MTPPAIDGAAARPSRARLVLLGAHVVATGVLLGVLQWSTFFFLQSYVAATAILYLLATMAWLIGSAIGLALPGEGELVYLAGAIGSQVALRALAARHAYQLGWLPALLVFVV